MIESVQERQKGAFDFGRYYENLCALQDSCPVPAVKAHLHEGVLDINGDRIRPADWDPILNSVGINKNLSFIGVRSYFQLKVDEKTSDRRAAILKSRIPVVRGKEMTFRLSRALRDCLVSTESLTCIELQGLPLREKDLSCLVKGLVKNGTLKHLSLEYCRIADFGVQIVCQALKQAGKVNTLNLTGCSLSYSGMEAIAELIKYQAMSRHNEAWKESLRYRRPNLDSMSGVRRITLNCNPLIDNQGAAIVAEAVKDDLWVKAIDLQQCGIGNVGAKAFLTVLKYNSTLTVLDLRQNPLIDRDILRAVTEQVLVNSNGKESDYRWLRVDIDRSRLESTPGKTRGGHSAVRTSAQSSETPRRPAFRPGGTAHVRYLESPRPPALSHPTDRDHRNGADEENRGSRGLPWRTAARASRYKGYPPDHVPGKTHLEEHSEASNDISSAPNTARTDDDVESANTVTSGVEDVSVVSPLVHEFEHSPPPANTLKELRIQVMHMRRQMNEEMRARRKAEEKMMELMMENQRLHRELDRRDGTEERMLGSRPLFGGAGLNDEKILRNIEQSFQQFHAFLDLLRDAGLGRVVTAAGMDQLPRVGGQSEPERTVYRDTRGSEELGMASQTVLDPVEQSYRSAANARSEADRLYLRLKEATSRGNADASRYLPTASVIPMNDSNEIDDDRTWTRDPPPDADRSPEPESAPKEENGTGESRQNGERYETIPTTAEDGRDISAAADALISPSGDCQTQEEEEREEEVQEDFRQPTRMIERSDRVSSEEDEQEHIDGGHTPRSATQGINFGRGATEDNVVSTGYNSDTFETSGDEGSRYGRSFGPEELGRMKASLDSVQEIDLQDF